MELTYYRKGDYLFPNLAVKDEPQTIGKYGMLRRTYLKENRKNWYQSMLMSGRLNQHLAQIEEEAENRMQEHGFTNFQRGELGSTRENLTSLQYQIEKDKERLANIQERVEAAQTKYEAAWNVRKTESEIDDMGKKTITGKYTVSKEDYKQLTALAKEGITSRQEIHKLNEDISLYKKQYIDCKYELRDTQSAYAALRRRCEPFLQALKYFPQFAKGFAEKIADLLEHREAQQKKEREEARRNPHRASARRQDDQDLER